MARSLNRGLFDWGESDTKAEVFIRINWELTATNFYETMSKKDSKDSHARVCLSRLTRILEITMLEELQQLEHTGDVARNLEIESNSEPAQKSFFYKSSEKINKIISRRGEKSLIEWVPINLKKYSKALWFSERI